MNELAVTQANNVVPPRLGNIICIAVDATSRYYDLSAILFNRVPSGKKTTVDWIYLSLQCESNDVYYAFDYAPSTTGDTILDTTATAAGGAPALDAVGTLVTPVQILSAQCAHLVSGLPEIPVRIQRGIDNGIILKCAAGKAATFRMWASSESSPGVT
jgi:hypothetical protein